MNPVRKYVSGKSLIGILKTKKRFEISRKFARLGKPFVGHRIPIKIFTKILRIQMEQKIKKLFSIYNYLMRVQRTNRKLYY
jgi:hypothetical protein